MRREADELGVSLEGISESYSERDSAELISRLTALKTRGFDGVTAATEAATREAREFGEGCRVIRESTDEGTEALERMTDAMAEQ